MVFHLLLDSRYSVGLRASGDAAQQLLLPTRVLRHPAAAAARARHSGQHRQGQAAHIQAARRRWSVNLLLISELGITFHVF